ncbi:helix-turn-helix domain-containing protein [uncultured Sphingomonas sp.]|uniref:helix-turn-helix domain-containing protein n=1 Tax=uncultured Sphingomonas sp. TaxID=158754 RepID=UPI0025D9B783|nr:helix-turn-helix domain-containing protein [uncultured Sphingomonas sp.]
MDATKIAFSVPEAMHATGLGRSTLYLAMQTGALEARKLGRRTLIRREALERFVASLPIGLDPDDAPLTHA